jgi:hypothetical protein
VNTPNDEIRRQLRAAEDEQRAALPRFANALRRAFDPDGGASTGERASLLGMPSSRRGFFRIGGLTVAASAVLVACASDAEEPGIAKTGPSIPESTAKTPGLQPSADLDSTLLLTAGSLEALAVEVYSQVIDNGWIEAAALVEAANLFRDQHAQHLETISGAARGIGATPYTEPNPYLLENVVQPAVTAAESAGDDERVASVLELAYTLENVAAQTYTLAGGLFTTPDLRQAGMSIGAVEARHVAVLLGALEEPQAPFAFGRTAAAAPEPSFITADGPVTPPTSAAN